MLTNRKSLWLMFTLAFLVLLGVTNAVLFNVALPQISSDLNTGSAAVSWIVIGYPMVIAIGAGTYGNLADRFPIKRLLLFGIGLFTAGSLLGSLAQTFPLILAARLLQASGGSSFIALSMIAAGRLIPAGKRPFALTLISSAIALGSGMGLLVGGYVSQQFGWHALFLLMFIALAAFVSLLILLPSSNTEKENPSQARNSAHRPLDIVGGVLTSAFIVTLLLGINLHAYVLILSALLLGAMFYWFPRARNPFIQTDLLRNQAFLRTLVMGFINNVAIVAAIFLLPSRLAQNSSSSSSMIGLVLFLGAMFAFLTSFWGGKAAPKANLKPFTIAASAFSIAGFLGLAFFTGTSLWWTLLPFAAVEIGYALLQVSLNLMVQSTIHEKEHLGAGLGLYNQICFIGMSFGPALSGRLLEGTHNYSLILILLGILFIVPILIALLPKNPSATAKLISSSAVRDRV